LTGNKQGRDTWGYHTPTSRNQKRKGFETEGLSMGRKIKPNTMRPIFKRSKRKKIDGENENGWWTGDHHIVNGKAA